MDEVKMEDGEEGEVDDHGLAISVRRVRHLLCSVFIRVCGRE